MPKRKSKRKSAKTTKASTKASSPVTGSSTEDDERHWPIGERRDRTDRNLLLSNVNFLRSTFFLAAGRKTSQLEENPRSRDKIQHAPSGGTAVIQVAVTERCAAPSYPTRPALTLQTRKQPSASQLCARTQLWLFCSCVACDSKVALWTAGI